MLKLFTGTDRVKVTNAFNEAAAGSTINFNPDNFKLEEFKDTLTSQSLFGGVIKITCRDLGSLALARETVEEVVSELTASLNLFLFLETGAKNSLALALAEEGEVIKFDLPISTSRAISPFALTDSLLARDRKGLWLAFQMARRQGLGVEEIFPALAWQAKTMLLVAVSQPEDKLDLKPFVLSKAKQGLKNYSLLELKKLFANLIELYHSSYPNSDEFEFGLEKIILTI
ncbi:MAG: hypothetical protein Q7T49_01450 [bacterium]|nr:hypothetical protein [bacterium]